MSWPVSLTSMRARVRKRADVVSETARHPDSEIDQYINDAIAELWDKIVEKNKDYRLSQSTISVLSGVAIYDLPLSCYKVRALIYSDGYLTTPLKPFRLEDIDHTGNSLTSTVSYLRYRSVGAQIFFDKLPASDATVTLYYTPIAPQYINPSDTVDFINGWDKYVEFKAAGDIECVDKRSDMSALYQLAEAQLTRIRNAANSRDVGEPETVLRRDISIPWYTRTR